MARVLCHREGKAANVLKNPRGRYVICATSPSSQPPETKGKGSPPCRGSRAERNDCAETKKKKNGHSESASEKNRESDSRQQQKKEREVTCKREARKGDLITENTVPGAESSPGTRKASIRGARKKELL